MSTVYDRTPSGAWISDDEKYRYALWRCWNPDLPPLIAIGCNPSTADAHVPDQTLNKWCGFSRVLNLGGVCIGNLWAYRSRDAKVLRKVDNANGDLNNEALAMMFALAKEERVGVLASWGAVARENGPHYEDQVCRLVVVAQGAGVPLYALKVAQDGATPFHPLMLPYSQPLSPWTWDFKTTCRDCEARP